jgi:hypothetical protein
VARAPGLLEGGLPVDVPAVRQEVDAFFAGLARLGETGNGLPDHLRSLPWLLLASAGTLALAWYWTKPAAPGPARRLPPDLPE